MGEIYILVYGMNLQDVFRPRLGPDNWMGGGNMKMGTLVGGWWHKGRVDKPEPTRRSISPGYKLWSAILEHVAGVCGLQSYLRCW